jgi:DNA repair protein RadD
MPDLRNVLERLSITNLQQLIGSETLASAETVLKIFSIENLNSSDLYTKKTLAFFALQNISKNFFSSEEGVRLCLFALTSDEIATLKNLMPDQFIEKEHLVSYIYKNLKKSKIQNILSDFFQYKIINEDKKSVEKNEISLERASIPYKPLKDYQFEVFFEAQDNLSIRDSRFILQMPTGSGKTRTAVEIVSDYINKNDSSSVIWLAHANELCDQAMDCFLEVWPHVALKDITAAKFHGKQKTKLINGKKIDFFCGSFQSVLASIDKNPKLIKESLRPNRLIVVDEAHKATAPTYKKVIQYLINENSHVMGLTATPGRSYQQLNTDSENSELAEFFFNKIISFKTKKDDTAIAYLRRKKVLAKAIFQTLSITGSPLTLTDSELKSVSKYFDLPADFLSKLGKDNLRNAEIIKALVHLVKEEGLKSIIVFATSLEQSKQITSILNLFNVPAAHVDGETPSFMRSQIINDFRAQRINVLCNFEVLSTGFDAPLVDCVFIARPTSSVVLYSQMIGRGLRGPLIGGKEKCRIINVKDNFQNLPSIDRMYNIFNDYWQN